MTWSILARDPDSGLFGIAIASRFFAVGALCPHAEAGVGLVSTQALMNPLLGPKALEAMRAGEPPEAACTRLIEADEGRDQRQLHLLDAGGRAAAHTGERCVGWCGHRAAENVSVAGNMLVGPGVVDDTLDTFLARDELPIVERLLVAMEAGETAGGDKRGRQSAAILVQGEEPYPRLSLRADDHAYPLTELRRLYAVARERFIPFSSAFPTSERPHGLLERNVLDAIIERDGGKPLGPLSSVELP